LDYAQFEITHVVPCTELYDMAIKQGRFGYDIWGEFVDNSEKPIEETVWNIDKKNEIEDLNREAFIKFYLRPGYILQRIRTMDSIPQLLWQLKTGIKILTKFILKS
ncbi:unnamed protein product, partial [marine sediment metagenome]